MNVILIGGTIEALVLAHHLQSEHHVIIIELEAELGLPVMHPGRVVNPELLHAYMTDEQQNFLLLSENEQGWGCRWDWVLKHLAANISRKGVQCFTRTRILSCSKENEEYILELSSTERHLPTHLTADRVIVMSPPQTSGPGLRQHCLEPSQPEQFPGNDGVGWKGVTVLTEDAKEAPYTDLHLNRGDGMTELWWKEEITWEPPRGFFESTSVVLSANPDELSFDGVVSRVLDFVADSV